MQNSLLFLVKTLSDLYLLTFLLRIILQWMRAAYYNSLAQFIWKVTTPLVRPVRRILPSTTAIDLAALLVLIALECVATWVLLAIAGLHAPLPIFALFVVVRLVSLTLWFYTVAIFIYVLLSWFTQSFSPMGAVLGELVEPVLRPARRLLPPVAGLDLAPALVMILLFAILIGLSGLIPPLLR
jgi:YggT family protein